MFEQCPPATLERRGLIFPGISEIKKNPENRTSHAIFHTSGRNLEADRDEQEACVFLCIFPCWEVTFTEVTVVLNLHFWGGAGVGEHDFLYFSDGA